MRGASADEPAVDCLALAVRRGAIARALRCAVTLPDELVESMIQMSKKRIHEIAKEQGLSSKELLEKLHAAGVEAKTASSSVEEAAAIEALGNGAAAAADAPLRPPRLRRSCHSPSASAPAQSPAPNGAAAQEPAAGGPPDTPAAPGAAAESSAAIPRPSECVPRATRARASERRQAARREVAGAW